MSYFVVDVESDGPVPPLYSMICFGAVLVKDMSQTFYAEVAPISEEWQPETLAISGFTREQQIRFEMQPCDVMEMFAAWIKDVNEGHPIFISDNPAYDWQWINYYFHKYYGNNPFGYSARRIGDLYCGLVGDSRARWKHLRKTNHTHMPVDDAKGNAEVLHYMKDELGLKIKF